MGRQFAGGVIIAAVGLAGCFVPGPGRAFLLVIPTGAIKAIADGTGVDAGDSEDELLEEERTLHSDRTHGESSTSRSEVPASDEDAGAKASRPTLDLPVQGFELANGMRVVVAPDPSLDEVTVVVHYAVGSADDPEGKDGLAHLVEHLMFDGSEHVGRGDYARWMGRVGGEAISGTTSLDSTDYRATVPPEQLPLVFWLESDRLGFLSRRLDEPTLQRERAIVTDEARDRDLARPFGAAGSAGLNKIFPEWHPYHRDYDSSGASHITLDDVRAFLRTWYSPRNATLIVVGRVEESVVLALAEKYFADLPGAAPPDRPALPRQWRVGDQRVDVTAHSSHDEVTFMWTAPALDLPGDAALDLAALILADPKGRLQRDLAARGIAASVTAREASFRRASTFVVSAVVAGETPAQEVVATIDQAIRDLGSGVQLSECERARDEWSDVMLLRLETSSGRAARLALRLASSSVWGLDKYDAVKPADVQLAVRVNLVPANRVIVVAHGDRQRSGQGGATRVRPGQ